jgi:tetratricopeptide (TPR) repeat protein
MAAAHRNLSSLLLWQNRHVEALQFALKAEQFEPNEAETHNTLGAVYNATQQTGKAIDCFQRAVDATHDNAVYHANLAGALVDARRLDDAREQFAKAIELDAGLPDAHYGLGMLQLLEGNYADGWKNYERRWRSAQKNRRHQNTPEWDGTSAPGRTLLVHCEQGLGDSIQFVRYLPLLTAQVGTLILECPPEARALFESIPGLAKVVTAYDPTPEHDLQIPLLSLPRVTGTTPDTVPCQVPYLGASQQPPALGLPTGKLKVGIAWAGNPQHRNDAFRSMQWLDCQALLESDRAHFVSLQLNAPADAATALGQAANATDAAAHCTDLAATAAIIGKLDLVISVDTATAHLAGALGKPVWLLLPFAGEWRWLHDRADSPWYPTMHIFRQPSPGDWAGVITDVIAALQQQPSPNAAKHLAKAAGFHQQDQLGQAIEHYQLAAKADPANTSLLRLLAGALRENSQADQARGTLERAIELQPGDAETHHDLGLLLSGLGQAEQALGPYHRAMELQPDCADFSFNCGNAHYALGQTADAKSAFQRATKLDPALAAAHFNLGQVAQDEGDFLTAAQAYKRAVDLDGNYTDAMVNLGLTLRDLEETALAEECFWHILQGQPGQPMAGVNLAKLQLERDDPAAAEATCRSVLDHHPEHPETLLNLGVALQAQNRVSEAIAAFEEFTAAEPQNPDGPFNLSIAELAAGNWNDGWQHYEARWQTDNTLFVPRHTGIPRWNGEPLAGKTLLLFAEQGFGDTLQFCRYAPHLANAGESVVIECQPGLRALLQTLPGVSQVFEPGDPVPVADFTLPMMSAPLAFGTTPETVPNGENGRYLSAQPSGIVPDTNSPKVGVVWAAQSRSWANNRSLPADLLSGLLDACSDFAWFNLQLEPSDEARRIIDATACVTNLSPHISDFASTASLIESMDLVVTVDTAVAHLAGALGKPTWVLLPFAAEWRWLLDREDTPWYPNTKLFRQRVAGDWPEVIGRVANELQRLAKR